MCQDLAAAARDWLKRWFMYSLLTRILFQIYVVIKAEAAAQCDVQRRVAEHGVSDNAAVAQTTV